MKAALILLALIAPTLAHAKLKVITTTTDLASITREIGADLIEVESLAKGTQDPHYLETKPSYMMRINRADLVIAVGLGLESGWLPKVIEGARNPKLSEGKSGYLELGKFIETIEKPLNLSRAEGDVHPEGNPHITLDPIRATQIAAAIAKRLGELDATNSAHYLEKSKLFEKTINDKIASWKTRLEKSQVKFVITHHKTLNYFLARFGIENAINLEPKPGIPPSGQHILNVVKIAREKKVNLILVENFFDDKPAKRVSEEIKGLRVQTVPVAVEGAPNVGSLIDLYETLVKAIEGSP